MSNLLSLPTGTVLVGDYRIERVLGAGGFGVTYLARETDVDRYVTIKEYFPTDFAARNDDLVAVPRSQSSSDDYNWGLDRFIDEARTLGKFDHQNIVRLYRYFRENNTAYMVLHFEEGQSLKAWLHSLGRAPRQKEIDQLVEPLLDALSVIHQADFLHRDIAPDNIIVRADGTPVLIDFGSARGEIAQHTRTISALVKPGYSPYEQYAETGKKQGPWTDIYALAGTLYHVVTGKRPPDSPSRVIKDELQPAEHAAVGAFRPRFLSAIDHGLQVEFDRRPQSIGEWRGNLLAPEERSQGWFAKRLSPGPSAPIDGSAVVETPTRVITAPARVAPPPDAPGAEGQFIDFVEQLQSADSKTELAPSPGEQGSKPNTVPPLPEPRTSLRSRLRLGWGVGRDKQSAPTKQPARAPAVEKRATPTAPAERLPVPVEPRPAPRILANAARPRPLRRLSPRWRPLLFKLLIGIGIASGAVALQDRIPKFEFRGTGTVSSASKPATPKAGAPSRSQSPQKPASNAPASLLLHRFAAHDGAIMKAKFAKNGLMIVTAGADGTIKVWDNTSRSLLRTLELDDGPATALATRGNLALTGHSEGVIALWDLDTGIKQRSFKRNGATIWAVVFAGSSERFWVASHDWTVALWETRTPSAPLQVLEGHGNAVQAISFSPSNALLASGGADKIVKLWNGASMSEIRSYRKARDFVTSLAFSSDGKTLVAGMLNGQIRVMSTRRRRSRTIRAHDAAVVAIKFNSNKRFVTAGKDGTLKQWSTGRRCALVAFGAAGNEQLSMDVSPDGSHLIAADKGGYITIWKKP